MKWVLSSDRHESTGGFTKLVRECKRRIEKNNKKDKRMRLF